MAANIDMCRPFLKKYFCSSINLPSDWIEVAEIYQVSEYLIVKQYSLLCQPLNGYKSYLPTLPFCAGVSRTNDKIPEISCLPVRSRIRIF